MNYSLHDEDIFEIIGQKLAFNFTLSPANNYTFPFLQSKVLGIIVVLLLCVKIATVAVHLPLSKNIFFADITKIELFDMLNQSRQKLGLGTLTESETLDKAAQLKAQDMINNGYFAHESPTGINPWFWFKKVNYKYAYAGENLAIGFVDSKNVYDAWMNSPSHKENLLNSKYTQVGTAIVSGFGQNNATVVVQLFGSLQNAPAPASIASAAPQVKLQAPKEVAEEKVVVNAPVQPEISTSDQTIIPQVLAGSTQDIIVSGEHVSGLSSLYLKFLNFVVYNNEHYLQIATYSLFWLILVGVAATLIISNHQHKYHLVLQPLALAVVVYVSLLATNDIILQIFPQTLII